MAAIQPNPTRAPLRGATRDVAELLVMTAELAGDLLSNLLADDEVELCEEWRDLLTDHARRFKTLTAMVSEHT